MIVRQAFGSGTRQVDLQDQGCARLAWDIDEADAARLDHTGQAWRLMRNQVVGFAADPRQVISDKHRAKPDQAQAKPGFSTARRAGDQDTAPVKGHAGRVQMNRRRTTARRRGARPARAHTGRPTTKRAPNGSDVTSASVGRIFSAQITPPWASTICLDMARPSPELSPNWCSGRSE